MNLQDILDAVVDEKSFLAFVKALESDWHENENEWENGTIPAFLESAVAWAEDMSEGNETYKKTGKPVGASSAYFICRQILRISFYQTKWVAVQYLPFANIA